MSVVDVATTCGLHRNEGHGFAGPWAFGAHGRPHNDILRERRAVDGHVTLEKGVPRNAQNVGVVENEDGVANLCGPTAVAGVELQAPRSCALDGATLPSLHPLL